MTPQQASAFAHFLVYSLISLYASRVVYLIAKRVWIALRRWYELRQIWNVFESDMDAGFLAEHNVRQRLGPLFDTPQLIEAMKAEMFPKRAEYLPDPDYRPFMNDAAEYESTESSKSAA